jgi:hypothetical protein
LDQLEMAPEENRYETERQASAAPTRSQREQSAVVDRLKQLAQRQLDLNDRLRELQTALLEARSDPEREDLQRQLKRLRDEERQMLANLDELRQNLARSPDPASAQARQQLDQTRSDVQRAAQELERDAVSQALAAGTRAQQSLQNAREDLRRQASSRFAEPLRQLRSQARDLARQEEDLARRLEAINTAERKTLDDSSDRQELNRQISRQQSTLTNILSNMRDLTELSETSEPLLSRQLYDALRRAEQARLHNLLEAESQLVERGFVPQAGEAERAARQHIDALRSNIERAAESVLGDEADALRFAQRELDDLARGVERELADPTNSTAAAGGAPNGSKPSARQRPDPADGTNDSTEERPSAEQNSAQAAAPGSDGNRARQPDGSAARGGTRADRGNGNNRRGAGSERLRQLVEEMGNSGGDRAPDAGPITGNDFVNWSDRLRDVEQVLDSADLRNQLATARERAGAFRGYFRQSGRKPEAEAVRNQILEPMTEVRAWLRDELARRENANSLVPLDRDPVPDSYSDLVRKYYEKLGSAR